VFQTGVAHLARRHPDVPIIPVFMHGLGKALPKGEALLVPFFCDMFVGQPLPQGLDKNAFMEKLDETMKQLSAEIPYPDWS
jgi:1-acyl-sn-glycerol-3-phosphate acyltransferase